MAQIDFYFDFMSPYSYLAFKILQRLKSPWNLVINYRPVRLPHIIKESGNAPPARIPARANFLAQDLRRSAAFYDIEFCPPDNFLSINMKIPGMMVIAVQRCFGNDDLVVEELVDTIWNELFGKGQRDRFTGDEGNLAPLIKKALKDDEKVAQLFGELKQSNVEQQYFDNSNEALKLGAFGVPTMIVTREKDGVSEFFFGSDRFHHIARFLDMNPTIAFISGQVQSKI